MKLIAGKINDHHLLDLLNRHTEPCVRVKAAVAYADGQNMRLLEACKKHNKPLEFIGRYDYNVPVAPKVLKWFLDQQNPNFQCKLIPQYFHSKVIWWQEAGAYIGSANMTDRGWFGNIETGMFLSHEELEIYQMEAQLEHFFNSLDEYATQLTREVYEEQLELSERRAKIDAENFSQEQAFQKSRHIPAIKSLIAIDQKKLIDKKFTAFQKEWDSTLEIMRTLSQKVASPVYLPDWITADVPSGVLTDRFLHLYYQQKVKQGSSVPYEAHYEQNKNNPERATSEALIWWKSGNYSYEYEKNVILEWAPKLKVYLSKERLPFLTQEEFKEMGSYVHAIRDHAIKMEKPIIGLPPGDHTIEEMIPKYLEWLWNQRSETGKTPLETLYYVIWGEGKITARLWAACHSEQWRIPHLNISAFGEIVGWARPEEYPPRNQRTSKTLRALGFNVHIAL